MFKHGRKFIGTLLIGFCCSQQGVAAINGHPDEDPVVKALRDAFAESVAPSAEEVVGKWKCIVFSAVRKKINGGDIKIEISRVVNNTFEAVFSTQVYTQSSYFRLMNDGFMRVEVSPWPQNNYIRNIRISKSTGELFYEYSVATSIDAPDSITQPLLKASNYGRCSKQDSE